MKYQLIDRTPEEMQCCVGACPAIYELTPEENQCVIGGCPSVFGTDAKQYVNKYLIVGTKVNPAEVGLEKKVGEGEILIAVPKGLIDGMRRKKE